MQAAPIVATLALGAAAWWYLRADAADEAQQLDAFDQLAGSAWDYSGSLMETLSPTDAATADANLSAFLAAIRAAEGTAGRDGYRTLFGGSLFTSYVDHPRVAVQFTDKAGRRLWTSAAGAYQFLAVSPLPTGGSTRVDTWDRIARRLGLQDFSPASQDAAAVELIREAGALYDVRAGRFDAALSKVRGIWASLPGAGYAQPERSRAWLAGIYSSAGGAFA